MYNLDLTFLKGSLTETDQKIAELKYNTIFKEKIAHDIHDVSANIRCPACQINTVESNYIDQRIVIEAGCKGLLGCHFCEVPSELNIDLNCHDLILVQYEDSIELAEIFEVGDIVKLKRQVLGIYSEPLPVLLRRLTDEDIETYSKNLKDELKARPVFKEMVDRLDLNMKLVDIHFQFDRKRLYFFYTADGRVDFRELAKLLASEFKTRIELRQIGVRDEAKRMGGLGSCGREYCCAAFITNFKRITTQIANDQNLSANMSKLSGPCGKLKCCLSFEID